MSRAAWIRYAVASIGLAILWFLFAWGAVPWLIQTAYDRTGVLFLNTLITGQNNFAPDFYFGRWDARRGMLTILALISIAGFAASAPLHGRLLQHLRKTLSRTPRGNLMTLIALGAVVGWVVGVPEGAWTLLRNRGEPSSFQGETIWMVPAMNAALGMVVGSLMALSGRGSFPFRHAAFVLTGLFGFGMIRSSGFGVHPAAAGMLALGVAWQTALILERRHERVIALARRALVVMGVVTLATGLGMKGAETLSERSFLAGLPNATTGAPNVLLLVLDTQRTSRMSLYGNPRPTTPNIDRVAGHGVVFDRAFSSTSWTLPGHATMLTGLWASEMEGGWERPLEQDVRTLAEVMAEHGYATGGFAGNKTFAAVNSGLNQGFGTYRDYPVSLESALEAAWTVRMVWRAIKWTLGVYSHSNMNAEDVSDEFLGWQDGLDRPFFAMLNYYDVHVFYRSPEPFDTLYRTPAPRYWLPNWGQESAYSAGDLSEIIDAYDSALTYMDDRIGKMLQELERRGVLEETIVIVTSDHGEHFAEQYLEDYVVTLHGNSLYTPAIHVPLSVTYPGKVPSGVRRSGSVATRDIPATILDLAGLDDSLPGTSLARHWLAPDSLAPGQSEPLHLELTVGSFVRSPAPIMNGDLRGVVRGRYYYIRNGDGSEELYDIGADIDQQIDLSTSDEHRDVLEQLRAQADGRPSVRD